MTNLYRNAILRTCNGVAWHLNTVTQNPESPKNGIAVTENGLFEGALNGGAIDHCIYAYLCPDSVYYKDKKLLALISVMLDGMKTEINEDGTTNGVISNFHQPELFEMPSFCRSYRSLLRLENKSAEEQTVLGKMYPIITRLSKGLLTSGFHTPNHRWVLTAALYSAYNTLRSEDKDEAMLVRAKQFLAEKIDIDENGEFAERSAGMYSAVTDRALCYIAVEAGMPELFNVIKRNLINVFLFFEKGDELFTGNSRRSDKGETDGSRTFTLHAYVDICLMCYANTHDMFFLQFLTHITDRTGSNELPAQTLPIFFEYPSLKTLELPRSVPMPELPEEFVMFRPENNILRIRKNKIIYTVLAGKAGFLQVTVGKLTASARICSSFFAIAQFAPAEIQKISENQYRLTFEAQADYKLPFENPPQGSENYWSMDYKSRSSIQACRYSYTVDLKIKESGISLHVQTGGMDAVPFKLELAVTPDVYVDANGALTIGKAGDFICAKAGDIALRSTNGDCITLRGAFAKHFYHNGMRGSVPVPSRAFMVYMTDFSPVDRTVEIDCMQSRPWDFYE